MQRWITIFLLLGGLGFGSYLSWRGHGNDPGKVTTMEDGTGFPTPRPR